MIFIQSLFLIAIFVIVWSSAAVQIVDGIWLTSTGEELTGIFSNRIFYAILIGALLLPTIFMKEIAELHWVSMSLFGSVLLFCFILILQIIIRGNHETNPFPEYADVKNNLFDMKLNNT